MAAGIDVNIPQDDSKLASMMGAFSDRAIAWEWVIAGFLTLLWLISLGTYGIGYFGIFGPDEARRSATLLEVILYVSALVLPVMLCWIGAFFIRQSLRLRHDAARLKESVDLLAIALNAHMPASRNDIVAAVKQSADEALRAEQKRIGTHFRTLGDQQQQLVVAMKALMKRAGSDQQALQELVSSAADVAEKAKRKAEAANGVGRSKTLSAMTHDVVHQGGQEMLPFAAPEQSLGDSDVEWADLVRALNFPHDEQDDAGFAAIKKFLPHRLISQVLQASEDVLSMLAQEGIYMDDLHAERANPDLWRAFAAGARGPDVAGMATIADQAAFALARGRMRTDQVFKDATMHFVRLFDRMLDAYLPEATDRDVEALAASRTGLAFTLLATLAGSFD